MLQLADWDENYLLNDVLSANESATLEKKSADKFTLKNDGTPNAETKSELAKQVSAFANSGGGFLVYGITDDGVLDAGVPSQIGNQPIKDWIEASIPKLLVPDLTSCEAKTIIVSGHHNENRCVLVIAIPLSDGRPHWVVNDEIAYIRSGAHSVPIRPQTLLDIASRSNTAQIVIEGLNPIGTPAIVGSSYTFDVNPTVKMTAGPATSQWGFELRVKSGFVRIQVPKTDSSRIYSESHVYFLGTEPLFPDRSTPVFSSFFRIQYDLSRGPIELTASLYAASARSDHHTFGVNDLDDMRQQLTSS
tara:strand:+ start:535 stop:1446 length:912 start_codon:yes stop_codon:yes gene_type:complete